MGKDASVPSRPSVFGNKQTERRKKQKKDDVEPFAFAGRHFLVFSFFFSCVRERDSHSPCAREVSLPSFNPSARRW